MSNDEFQNIQIIILWLTDRKNNREFLSFQMASNNFSNSITKIFTEINKMINHIKKIKFINTYIIITDSKTLYSNFIDEFSKNIKDFFVIPKFIIYTRQKNEENDNINNSFYNYGGKKSSFNDIFDFIKKDLEIPKYKISNFSDTFGVKSKLSETQKEQENGSILEPIEEMKPLDSSLYFKTMRKIRHTNDFDEFTKALYEEYKDDNEIAELLSQIIKVRNIPKELLCKYLLRAYTASSSFSYDLNNFLKTGRTSKYTILFITLIYEGLRLKVFDSPAIKCLYKGVHMKKKR